MLRGIIPHVTPTKLTGKSFKSSRPRTPLATRARHCGLIRLAFIATRSSDGGGGVLTSHRPPHPPDRTTLHSDAHIPQIITPRLMLPVPPLEQFLRANPRPP